MSWERNFLQELNHGNELVGPSRRFSNLVADFRQVTAQIAR
jgi:hypothetical protein